MQALQVCGLVLWGIDFAAIGISLLLSELLFRALEKDYPIYYKKIGQPVSVRAMYIPEPSDISRRYRSNSFLYSLVFKGISVDFPKNRKLRKLAKATRYIGMVLLSTFPISLGLFLYFAHLNKAP